MHLPSRIISNLSQTITSTFSTTRNVTQTITVPAETTVATITTSGLNYTSTKTTYAACATNNLLGPRLSGGNYANTPIDNTPSNVGSGTNATSSYECCTICQDAVGSCDFAYFDDAATSNKCVLYSESTAPYANATCSHSQAGYFTSSKTAKSLVVINGPCGSLTSGKPAAASAR